MPLQNRVDPFSRIHAVAGRGLFTGNRGILHDAETRTLNKQSWATTGWVICALEYKGHQAPIMGPSHWTELFFLDEAVGLAAGHRPCYACRTDRARAFCDAAGVKKVSALNALISAEMKPHLRVRAPRPRAKCDPFHLPDGAMFAAGNHAFLKWNGKARLWSFAGYGGPQALPSSGRRLTPEITCKALTNGYAPILHASLQV